MDPRVYDYLGRPPIVAGADYQVEAAKLGIATPADLVTDELAGILGEVGLIPGEPVFAALTSGGGWASRYTSYFEAPVTMMSGESQQYALQNAGLGYRVMGAAPLPMKPGIAAEALVFGPSSVRVWEDRMSAIDFGTSVVPYVSDARDASEVWTGEDAVTGERLHWWGQRGVTTAAMVFPFLAGAWFRQADGALEETPLVAPYRYMSQMPGAGQAHHLNQSAVYRDVIAFRDGMSIKLVGDAISGVGTPHYIAHQTIEAFLDIYRSGRAGRELPTNLELTRATFDSLIVAGIPREQAMKMIREAVRERVRYGLLGGEAIPRMPVGGWQR